MNKFNAGMRVKNGMDDSADTMFEVDTDGNIILGGRMKITPDEITINDPSVVPKPPGMENESIEISRDAIKIAQTSFAHGPEGVYISSDLMMSFEHCYGDDGAFFFDTRDGEGGNYQNDTTAADYIKNRPGAYMGDETIYDGTPTTALASGSCRAMLSPAFTLTAGNAYRVTFNGTAYVLTAQDKTAELKAIILGELTSDNKRDFTNYPFCIYQMGQLAALWTEAAGTYTLKVESLGTVVVPLDSRFMPLGYATEEFVTNAINAALYVDSETEVG